MLCNADILDTFKSNIKLVLEVDALSVGLGSVIKQELNKKITTIAFASKKLSSAEEYYSSINKPLKYLFEPNKNIPAHSNFRIQ